MARGGEAVLRDPAFMARGAVDGQARGAAERIPFRRTHVRYTGHMGIWYVYLIECRDGSVYTGIASDVARRYAAHAAGKGARYTRSHPPLRLLAQFAYPDRAAASRAEHAIKQLSPARKRALCAQTAPVPAPA